MILGYRSGACPEAHRVGRELGQVQARSRRHDYPVYDNLHGCAGGVDSDSMHRPILHKDAQGIEVSLSNHAAEVVDPHKVGTYVARILVGVELYGQLAVRARLANYKAGAQIVHAEREAIGAPAYEAAKLELEGGVEAGSHVFRAAVPCRPCLAAGVRR